MGQIAARYKLPKATVQHILEHYNATGSLDPKPRNCGRKPAFSADALGRLKADALANPMRRWPSCATGAA